MPHRTISESPGAYFDMPINRRQLLKGAGGALAFAMAGGMLGTRNAFSASAPLPHVVLIVLDGARPEYLSLSNLPHVRDLIRRGTSYTQAFSGILESETPSGHVAIGTGSEPRATGIPSFWWADSDNVTISLFSPAKIQAGQMESIIRQSRVPTLAHLVHQKARTAKVVALSGSKYYAADAIGGPDADVTMYFQGNSAGAWAPTAVSGHTPPAGLLNSKDLQYHTVHLPFGVENHLAMKLAAETFTRMRQQVTLINLPEFDWPLGHVNGGTLDQARVTTLMRGFDSDLAMLKAAYDKVGVLDRTIFVLMADHGMMPLAHKVAAPDLQSAVEKAGTKIVTDAYTSAGYLWLEDSSRISRAALNIAAMRNPYIQAVYMKTPSARGPVYVRATDRALLRGPGVEAANQYLLNSFAGPNSPDLAVLFTENVGSEPGGQAAWKADHGGTSWQSQHIPLVISGPGIRSGITSNYPARLIDIAPTILQAMGASHKGMQGIPLADAFIRPPSWTVQWQQAARKKLTPVVTALQQQSQYEVKARL